jgi:hypothetical protein
MTLTEILKANGVADEATNKILAAMKDNSLFIAGEENLDIRYKKAKAQNDSLTAQYAEAEKLIEQLKAGNAGSEALKGKITEYEAEMNKLKDEKKQTQLEAEIKVALLSAKATDLDYMTFKLKEKGELELDDNGKIKGIDDKIAGLKTQFPNQFENTKGNGKVIEENKLPKGDDNTPSVTKEQFAKMGYKARVELKQNQPEVYNTLTK